MIPKYLTAAFVALFCWLAALPAQAQEFTCASISRANTGQVGPADVKTMRDGLGTILAPDGVSLGADTVVALRKLCAQAPMVPSEQSGANYVALALEYGRLSQDAPTWIAEIASPGFPNAGFGGFNRDFVALAGSTAMKVAQINDFYANDQRTCTDIPPALAAKSAEARAAIAAARDALVAADPMLADVQTQEDAAKLSAICALYPGAKTTAQFLLAMERLGDIEGQYAGALEILGSAPFETWMKLDPAPRFLRLMGLPGTTLALLGDYAPLQVAGVPKTTQTPTTSPQGSAATAPAECTRPQSATPGRFAYYRLTEPEPGEDGPDIAAELEPLKEEFFASKSAIVAAITQSMGLTQGSCNAELVAALVEHDGAVTSSFTVPPEGLTRAKTDAAVRDAAALLEPFLGIASAQPALSEKLFQVFKDHITQAVTADYAAAADIAAASAEDVTPVVDQPFDAIEPRDPDQSAKRFAITDFSVQALAAQETNAAIVEKISNGAYFEVESRDLIKVRVMEQLSDVRAKEIEAELLRAKQLIDDVVAQQFQITDGLIANLASSTISGQVDLSNLADHLAALSGVIYPEKGLLSDALRAPSTVAKQASEITDNQVAALIDASLVNPPGINKARWFEAVAQDCNCSGSRLENGLIYGVVPFWLFPEKTDPAADAPTDEEREALPKIDFGLVDRIAFDGLEVTSDGVIYDQLWQDAAARFVSQAHRFEVEADLYVRLSGWQDWTSATAAALAREVAAELNVSIVGGPFSRLDATYSSVPDGVTIVVDGYDEAAAAKTDLFEGLRSFVTVLKRALRKGQDVNLAFDLDLSEATANAKIFERIAPLLVPKEGSSGVQEREAEGDGAEPGDAQIYMEVAPVNLILVFLERPTTDAKKVLRSRIEATREFRGENRRDLFRKVIPVLSPGGNQALAREGRDGRPKDLNAFGQFFDDLVYFKDSFGGVGFWPIPIAGATVPDEQYEEFVATIDYELGFHFYDAGVFGYLASDPDSAVSQWFYELFVATDRGLSKLCTYICPNRNALFVAAGLLAAVVAAILFFGMFSRWVASAIVVVRFLFLAVFVILVLIALCSAWAQLYALAALVVTVLLYLIFRRAQSRDLPIP